MPDEAKMPFLAHLEELRKRLIICFSAIGVAFVLVFEHFSFSFCSGP